MEPNKSINKVVKDLTNDEAKHYISKGTFEIALGYINNFNSSASVYLLDPSYFSIKAYNIHSIFDSEDQLYTLEEIELGR